MTGMSVGVDLGVTDPLYPVCHIHCLLQTSPFSVAAAAADPTNSRGGPQLHCAVCSLGIDPGKCQAQECGVSSVAY